ncbi:MAG: PAS domain S-box protein [Syntrophales bacterium]
MIAELSSLRRQIAEQEQSKPAPTPAELLIRVSEAKYQRLFDIATIGIFQSSAEGKVLTANSEFAQMFGYESPADVIASINDVATDMYVNPQRRSEIMRLMMENPSLRSFENIYRRKDGSTFTGNLHIWPVQDVDGRLLTIEGFVEDITERKRVEEALQRAHNELEQRIRERTEELVRVNEELRKEFADHKRAEEALRESEANYRRLYDSSPSVIYQIDFRTGKFLKANDIVCKYLGCTQEEITSRSPYDLLTDESKIQFLERLSKMSRGEKVTENPEYEVMDKNGRRWWLQLSSKNSYDPEGLAGADVVAHDITDRKRTEEKLNNHMEFITTLLNTIPSPVFYKDITGKYLGCNRAFEELIGKSREEIIGKDIYSIYPAEMACEYYEQDRILYECPGSQIYDGKFGAADGSVRDVIINKATYTDTGKNVAGVVGVLIDITDRKRAAEALDEERRRLQMALDEVRTLRGIVPICANCKKIRDDKGYWNQVEKYVSERTEAEFSHGICPDCAKKLYPEFYREKEADDKL